MAERAWRNACRRLRSTPQPLFRCEALKTRDTTWLDSVPLAQPLWLLTVSVVVAGATILLLVTLGTYTRRFTFTGQLVPTQGLACVVTPASGVVTRLDVAEGGQAAAGGALALVTVLRATQGSGDTQQARQPLLSLLPGDGKQEAGLLVPSRAIGFIAPGDTVLLRYQAFP